MGFSQRYRKWHRRVGLAGEGGKGRFIECYMKWETPEQVSQQFLASQDGKVVPVERAEIKSPWGMEGAKCAGTCKSSKSLVENMERGKLGLSREGPPLPSEQWLLTFLNFETPWPSTWKLRIYLVACLADTRLSPYLKATAA